MPGLYIHIPYCMKKCAYCDFVSFPEDGSLAAYVDALIREIQITAKARLTDLTFDTVFFGGGTPSLLGGAQMGRIMDALQDGFSIAPDAECSMECNPGTTTAENLLAYRAAGLIRLSIGLQSADDTLLRSIGRIHTFQQFLDTLTQARQAGFWNVNADVMHGLPGQTGEQYLSTLRTVADLEVPHVSSYALILNEGTPLYRRVKNGETALPDPDDVADMEDEGLAYLASRGYERYEISNFAQPGYACRHNLTYWHNEEYLGLGLAAHSALRLGQWTRFANVERLKDYFHLISKGKRPVQETIRLYQADEMFETVMMGFRLIQGIDRAAFSARFGVDLTEAYPAAMEALRQRGWVAETPARIRLTDKGLDLQNQALQFFL